MSWDVELVDPVAKTELHAPDGVHQFRGGTYAMGGTTACWLNVTYNYSSTIRAVLGVTLWELEGKTGAETLPVLEAAIAKLGDAEPDADYWKATGGNAKAALVALAQFARWHPQGVWSVR